MDDGKIQIGWLVTMDHLLETTNFLFASSNTFTGSILWRPLLPYGYSYKASCARPG